MSEWKANLGVAAGTIGITSFLVGIVIAATWKTKASVALRKRLRGKKPSTSEQRALEHEMDDNPQARAGVQAGINKASGDRKKVLENIRDGKKPEEDPQIESSGSGGGEASTSTPAVPQPTYSSSATQANYAASWAGSAQSNDQEETYHYDDGHNKWHPKHGYWSTSFGAGHWQRHSDNKYYRKSGT